MNARNWAFWIAFAVLVTALGKFLDDYHIRSATKSRMRESLIHAFVHLDNSRVPDVGGAVLQSFRWLIGMRRVVAVVVVTIAAVWATLSSFYLKRLASGPLLTEGYFAYLFNWIPWDSMAWYWLGFLAWLTFFAVSASLAAAQFFHFASVTSRDWKRILLLLGGLAAAMIIAIVGALTTIPIFGAGGYGSNVIIAALAAIFPVAGLAAVTVALIVLKLWFTGVRFVLLYVLDVASDPKTSPFAYCSSFLGLSVLLMKLGQALVAGGP